MFQGVSQILVREGRAVGVRLGDGTEILADVVLSNATPKVTFLDLLEEVSNDVICSVVLFPVGNTE